MEFITNQKGRQSLIWDGSRFTINRKMDNGTVYWRCCKRWHNWLKRVARKAHPNFYEFIEIIQKEQAATLYRSLQLSGGGRIRAKRKKVVQHEETIKRLTEELTNGSRSLDSFLSSISHCVLSFDY